MAIVTKVRVRFFHRDTHKLLCHFIVLRPASYGCSAGFRRRGAILDNGACIFGVALTIAETPPGHSETRPHQEAAAQRSQAGDGLAGKTESFAGVETAHPTSQFSSWTSAAVGFPFD